MIIEMKVLKSPTFVYEMRPPLSPGSRIVCRQFDLVLFIFLVTHASPNNSFFFPVFTFLFQALEEKERKQQQQKEMLAREQRFLRRRLEFLVGGQNNDDDNNDNNNYNHAVFPLPGRYESGGRSISNGEVETERGGGRGGEGGGERGGWN